MRPHLETVEVGDLGLRLRITEPRSKQSNDSTHTTAPPPTIVLVHGIGMSHRSFMRVGARLARSYRTVTVDLPGFGGTRSPRRPLGVEGHAAALAAALERLDIRAAAVVGQSMVNRPGSRSDLD